MTMITKDSFSQYIAERLTKMSEEDIKSLTLFHPHRLSRFQIEMLKSTEDLIVKKIKEES